MSASTLVANAFVLVWTLAGLSFAYAAWRDRFASVWTAADAHGRRISWTLLTAHLFVQSPIVGGSRDISALASEGPSAENLLQAAVVVTVAVWSFHLLARSHVRLATLRAGPALWISLLAALYLVSTAWSVWPVLTLYRATELAVFWVLIAHLFAQPAWEESLRGLLWLGLAFAWLTQLVHLDLTAVPDRVFGFAYDNVSTLVAAAVLLVEVHRWTFRSSRGAGALVAVAGFSVVAFGSLATSVALLVAGGFYVAARARTEGRTRDVLLLATFITVSAMSSLLLPTGGGGDDLVAEVAELSGKDITSLESMTGRLPLWRAIGRATVDEPLGLGFAGAERALSVGFVRVEEVGWTAGHAHNGYLSGWLGGGWLGLLLVAMIFVTVWQWCRQLPVGRRALVIALLVLLAVNNLTAAAVGGALGLPWMVMMALACAPPASHQTGTGDSRWSGDVQAQVAR